ncbi:MAG: hypothetical protein HS116_00650 [Planctomycetes bacterium]|nr:hypothetical protein [Planctomycetota bacterium]
MASWHYAFFFPGPRLALKPAGAVSVLADFGLEFDDLIRPANPIDELGHLEHGEEVRVAQPIKADLIKRLSKHEQFLVECRNSELFFVCGFATGYSNPYMEFGWSKRLFHELNESRKRKYWNMIKKCASYCNAAHVIVVDDPPDYFEDRFPEIGGRRILESEMPNGNKCNISVVWTDMELSELPVCIDRQYCNNPGWDVKGA